jgi:hypothetical protein
MGVVVITRPCILSYLSISTFLGASKSCPETTCSKDLHRALGTIAKSFWIKAFLSLVLLEDVELDLIFYGLMYANGIIDRLCQRFLL